LAVLTGRETNSIKSTVFDVIETKKVPKNYNICIATCRKNRKENIEIIALAKYANANYYKQISKSWRCNRDKMRFEYLDKKGIDCLNEGQD
jgi:glycogen synthase